MGGSRSASASIGVVDDDDAVCQAISSLLRSVGYGCATFGSAEAFLASGWARKANCLILDYQLTGLSGLELQQALSRMSDSAHTVPIIFVTACSDDTLRKRALLQGALAFLPKPFDDEDLLRAIRRALGNWNPADGRTAIRPECY